MAREIPNKPHTTPSSDGPHATDSTYESEAGAEHSLAPEDATIKEAAQDESCFDELGTKLYPPLVDPDPILTAHTFSDPVRSALADKDPVTLSCTDQKRPPRTSEIFTSIRSSCDESAREVAASDVAGAPYLREVSSESETAFDRSLVELTESITERPRPSREVEWACEDERQDSRSPWALVALMSYSSAVTLVLTWFVWTGRPVRPTEAAPAHKSLAVPESAPKIVNALPSSKLPLLPSENIAFLGKTIQLGDLEVTPQSIEHAPVSLVHSIDLNDWRREELASLILRLKLRNTSIDREFAPLERRYVREQTAEPDRSMIAASHGLNIDLFPLAVDSEWLIEGEVFTTLKPGETMETMIASESGVTNRLTDDMTWRLRLRIGPYRTDVLGVHFDRRDVQNGPP